MNREGIAMNALFDPKSPKKACNVSVNEDLLRQARWIEKNGLLSDHYRFF